MSNDEWKTVPSRPVFGVRDTESTDRPAFGRGRPSGGGYSHGGGGPAPAAFGGGNSEKMEQRRQATEARAAFQAAETREQKKVEAAAASKQAEAENFTSETSYPSLGSSTVGAPKPAMNYKQVVKEMIAREAEAQVAAAAAAEAATYTEMMTPAAPASRSTVFRQRILDELEDDYSGPEEDENEDDEVNADIGSGRRRGDKGIW
jgi:hypothetical protein